MTSCERCWALAQANGIEYREQLNNAEATGAPCTEMDGGTLSLNARRLRAGQFWDEETQTDSRAHLSSPAGATPAELERASSPAGEPDAWALVNPEGVVASVQRDQYRANWWASNKGERWSVVPLFRRPSGASEDLCYRCESMRRAFVEAATRAEEAGAVFDDIDTTTIHVRISSQLYHDLRAARRSSSPTASNDGC